MWPDVIAVEGDMLPSERRDVSENLVRNEFSALAPHVVGEVELYLTAAASVSDAPQRMLLLKLLPAASRVRIDKLTVKGKYDVTSAADAIRLDQGDVGLVPILAIQEIVGRPNEAVIGDGPELRRPAANLRKIGEARRATAAPRATGSPRSHNIAFWRAISRRSAISSNSRRTIPGAHGGVARGSPSRNSCVSA